MGRAWQGLLGVFLFLFLNFIELGQATTPRDLHLRLPFRIEHDNVSIRNAHDGYSFTGAFPFGVIGDQEGVCEGISGVTAAFLRHAVFRPAQSRAPSGVAQEQIDATLAAYRTGCNLQVEIAGYRDLWELSTFEGSYLRTRIVDMNLANIKEQALAHLGSLFFERDPRRLKEIVQGTLPTLIDDLQNGRYPLILYRSHVVMAYGIDVRLSRDGRTMRYAIQYFDPNWRRITGAMEVITDAGTGLVLQMPEVGPIWNVSPDRPPYRGDCRQIREMYSSVLPARERIAPDPHWNPFRENPFRADEPRD